MVLDDAMQAPRLDRAEWQAVAVALRDADCRSRSVGFSEGRLGRLLRWLTGIEAPRPLADPRLEALRRFICASRGNLARAGEAGADLLRFGYNRSQIEALRLLAR